MGVKMTDATKIATGHIITPRRAAAPSGSHMQWRVVDIPRDITRAEAARLLSEQAEYGSWELARSVMFVGGARRVWLRRRALRVQRTDTP